MSLLSVYFQADISPPRLQVNKNLLETVYPIDLRGKVQAHSAKGVATSLRRSK